MKNQNNLSNFLNMIRSQGFEAEHALLVRLFGCIEAYRRLPDEPEEKSVFVPIRDFVLRIGYNDLSNVKQEDILISDKQSEDVIHTVKSDPGDDQDVEETEKAMRGWTNSVTGWKGKAMLGRGFHNNHRTTDPGLSVFTKATESRRTEFS